MAFDLDAVVVKRNVQKKPTLDLTMLGGADKFTKPPVTQGLPKILVALYSGPSPKNPLPKKLSSEAWAETVAHFADPHNNIGQIKKLLSANLTKGQREAFNNIADFILDKSPHRFFTLQGYAGTGKTYVVRRLTLFCGLLGIPWLLTAPTNKATKVLTTSIPGVDKAKCKTIYSALKLTMSTDEDQQVLVDGSQDNYASLDIPSGTLLCVDEASMLNSQVTQKTKQCSIDLNLRTLIIGDPYQLRPVGEERSTAWDLSNIESGRIDSASNTNLVRFAKLTEVRRFENELLNLSDRLRALISYVETHGKLPAKGLTGLFQHVPGEVEVINSKAEFDALISELKTEEEFADCKVIGWRNKTVEQYNELIRKNLGFTDEFNIGDLLMLAQPKLQKVNYRRSVIVANIDEEVVVKSIAKKSLRPTSVYFPNLPVVEYWELTTQTTEYQDKPLPLVLNVPLAEDYGLEDALQQMAVAAKRCKQLSFSDKANSNRLRTEASSRWKEYWALREEFTLVRFAYSFTAHRAQGSSIGSIFVDARDILANPELMERLQCLYVACTRARILMRVLL